VLVFTTPELGLRDVWTIGLIEPVAVAPGPHETVYVLDAGVPRVLRIDAWGTPDAVWALTPAPADPRALATEPDGTLFVADGSAGVRRYHDDGSAVAPVLLSGVHVAALAAGEGVLYAADETAGEILVVDLSTDAEIGPVAGFVGTVSALAVSRDGDLYVKPDGGETYCVARAGRGRVARGAATAGPLDAGEDQAWERVRVDAQTSAGTSVRLETFTTTTRRLPSGRRPPRSTPRFRAAASSGRAWRSSRRRPLRRRRSRRSRPRQPETRTFAICRRFMPAPAAHCSNGCSSWRRPNSGDSKLGSRPCIRCSTRASHPSRRCPGWPARRQCRFRPERRPPRSAR
jgi:hypothetical protein